MYNKDTVKKGSINMNLSTLLNAIDGAENITIIHCNSRKELYRGQRNNVHGVDYNSEVTAIYTTNCKMVIEVCN